MSFPEFLKMKRLSIILLVFAEFFICEILAIYGMPRYSVFYILFVIFLAAAIPLTVEFIQKRVFYKHIKDTMENLDRLYLMSEVIERPDFYEGDMFCEALQKANLSMNDRIGEYRRMTEDYIEYVEKWVHEIKTPIAAAKLAAENRRESSWEDVAEDLDKIESYVNQTLFYSRVNNAENDYIIKRITLNKIVANALKSNAKMLIKNDFSIKRENLDIEVMTDEKWTAYILEQIFSNSVKYKTEDPELIFSGREAEQGTYLDIIDNGIGIDPADLPRIFEKNFTGGNGRLNKRSTGFGLYLCKKLCDKMGVEITADSQNGKGTTITIYFPKNNYTDI